mgnify:CR=1 FL=1
MSDQVYHLNCAECAKTCPVTYGTYRYHTKKSETELSTYSFVCSKFCRSLSTDKREAKRKIDHAARKAAKKAARKAAKADKIAKGPTNNRNAKSITAQNCLDIVEKRKNGQTLESIGIEYGVTRERIRQVILPYNIPVPPIPPKLQKEYNCVYCGKNIGTKRKYCSKECYHLSKHSGKKFSQYDHIKLICDGCGKTFTRSKRIDAIVKLGKVYKNNPEKLVSKQNFCTKECYCQTKLGNTKFVSIASEDTADPRLLVNIFNKTT